MRTFDAVWTEAVKKHCAMGLKGVPVLMGRAGSFEVCYIYGDECNPISDEYETSLGAAEEFLATMNEKAEVRKAELRKRYEADLAALEGK